MEFGLSKEIISKIKEIAKKYNKYQFKIFGSRVKSTYKNTSDIDIAIFSNIPYEEEYKIRNEFDLLDIIYKIDLVFVNDDTNEEFLKEIQKEGVLI